MTTGQVLAWCALVLLALGLGFLAGTMAAPRSGPRRNRSAQPRALQDREA